MQDPIVVSIGLGALSTTNTEIFRVPSTHGGITLNKAYIVTGSVATITLQLNNNGTSLGTAISSTVGTLANATTVAGVPKEITISTAYQSSGTWLAVAATSGAGVTITNLVLEYKFGK